MHTHPAADIFPMMGEAELAELTKDIEAHGQRVPIVTYRGEILDGRSRFQACLSLGKLPRTVEWDGIGSPTEFAWSMNGSRRHLTPSQKAAVAVEMLPLLEAEAKDRQGARTDLVQTVAPSDPGKARDKAAEITGANRQYVSDTKRLKADAPELFEQVKRGEATVPEAKREAQRRQAMQEAADVQAVLDAAPDDGGRLANASVKAAYSRGVLAVYRLRELDPEQIAATLRDGDVAAARWFITDTSAWLDRLGSALGRGIRIVGGDEAHG